MWRQRQDLNPTHCSLHCATLTPQEKKIVRNFEKETNFKLLSTEQLLVMLSL